MSAESHLAPRAMILAAGKGTRLWPLTARIPKAMVSVGGRPLLEHTVELLREHGVRDIAINLHAHADVIAEHFGDGSRFGVRLTYSFEPQLLGTAGAVKKLEEFFKDGTFYVVYGDVLTRLDLGSLLDYHHRRGAMATIALHQAEEPQSCGVVRRDEHDWITSFIEKPETEAAAAAWVNAGIYVAGPGLLEQIGGGVPQDFGRDVFPRIVGNGGGLAGFQSDAVFWDVGTVERLRMAESWLLTVPGNDRHRNGIGDIADKYLSSVQQAISAVDLHDVTRVAEVILDARASGHQVLIAGNGSPDRSM